MWEMTSQPKTVRVTKAIVREFSEMLPVPNDRPYSEKRATVYRKALDVDELRPVNWALCFCEETQLTYRVNGSTPAWYLRRCRSCRRHMSRSRLTGRIRWSMWRGCTRH